MTLDISNVTYTEATLWEAIYIVVPGYKVARDGGAMIFAPTSLMQALLTFFVEREAGRSPESHEAAGRVLLRAYEDLNANGSFNYAV